MKTVWKCEIPLQVRGDQGELGAFTLVLPQAYALSVGLQDGLPMMWLEVNSNTAPQPHDFFLAGTGKPVPDMPRRFVGTYQMGWFVGHVYQLGAWT